MYSVNHTTHALTSHSDSSSARIRASFKGYQKSKNLFAQAIIKGDRISFFETYDEAKAYQLLLALHGGF